MRKCANVQIKEKERFFSSICTSAHLHICTLYLSTYVEIDKTRRTAIPCS